MRQSFFYGRQFVNDEDLNEQAQRWLDQTANVRVHATTDERPEKRFERDERGALGPLPPGPYRRVGAPSRAESGTQLRRPQIMVEQRPLSVYGEIVR